MQLLLTDLLGLKGIEVESYQERGGSLVLDVEAKSESATCPRCGEVSPHLHQNHGHLVRDLNLSERQVWLNVNRRQFKCQSCQKPFSEELDFVGKRMSYTNRLAERVVKQVIHSDVSNVARNHGLSEGVVWSMVEYLSQKNSTLTSQG